MNERSFLPKNIRQIGYNITNDKIYIEDYVMTYIKQLSEMELERNRILVLVGYKCVDAGISYSFINGVVEPKKKIGTYMELLLNENLMDITREKEDYYGDKDILGLCVICKNEWLKFNEDIYGYFRNGLVGDIVVIRDEIKEEQIFRYCNNNFLKQRGYYIYYDRNESMQNYMLCMKDGKSIEYGYSTTEIIDKNIDKKIRSFTIPKNDVYSYSGNTSSKYKMAFEEKWSGRIKYALASICLIAVLMVGVVKVDKLEKITKEKAGNTIEKSAEVIKNDSSKLEVETVSSDIRLEETVTSIPEEIIEDSNSKEKIDDNKDGQEEKNADVNSYVENEKENIQVIEEKSLGKNEEVSRRFYIVKKGDALVDISRKMYGTHKKVSQIKAANGIKDENKIMVGEKLIIP